MDNQQQLVLDLWAEYKVIVESLEEEIFRFTTKGSRASGIRVRKGMRLLRILGGELVKASLGKAKDPLTEGTENA